MNSRPLIVFLAPPDRWLEPEEEDPSSYPWRERWEHKDHPIAPEEAIPDLVVSPPGCALNRIRSWRDQAPSVSLLLVVSEEDPGLSHFFGDEEVFFLRPPANPAELRRGIGEVLAYKQAFNDLSTADEPLPLLVEGEPVHGWIELTAPSHPIFLRRFRAWIEALHRLPFTRTERRRLVHAVREVGWNAIEWGNHFDPRRRVSLSFLVLADRVLVRVENEVEDDDWYSRRGHDDPCLLQRERASRGIRPGGLGLRLVEQIMDRVAVSQRGHIVILEKRLPSPVEEAATWA